MPPHTEVASMPSASRIADSGRPAAVLDAEAFRGLHQAEAVAIWNYACYRLGPEAAEDAVADVFARAWAARAGWRPDRGTAGAWLWGIARNVVTDGANRRRTAPAPLPDDLPDEAPGSGPEPGEVERALAAVAALAALDQDIIALRFGAGHTNRAIAALLDLSEAAVAQRLRRALRSVRVALEGPG
jgi:RNA polymerase sigma-70 factor (ECF subfamily)